MCRNVWFSLASTAIVSACIFLFCVFFSIITNIEYMVTMAETTMGITVFFDEDLSEAEIQALGEQIQSDKAGLIKSMNFISAEEAWNSFQTDYFGEEADLAEGFAEDNPLAGSASYEIFLKNISSQDDMVKYLETLNGVRKVNYSSTAAAGLTSFNRILAMLFGAIIIMLLAVAVFLISNTISVAAEFRKNENKIMRLIGATNFMIRAPFVVEGIIIGIIGASIPLGLLYLLYTRLINFMGDKFNILTGLLQFLPVNEMFRILLPVGLGLGVGIGFFGSFFTIRKHLKV